LAYPAMKVAFMGSYIRSDAMVTISILDQFQFVTMKCLQSRYASHEGFIHRCTDFTHENPGCAALKLTFNQDPSRYLYICVIRGICG